jgi:hypothetical protein
MDRVITTALALLTLTPTALGAPVDPFPCYVMDFDQSGSIDSNDIATLIELIDAGYSVSDINQDGKSNTDDLYAFMNRSPYGQGCNLNDSDNDRIPDIYETDNGVFVDFNATGTDPFNPDTDNDGILDGDEILGTRDFLDLPALGANPLRRDIFVEVDWIAGPGDYRLRPAAVSRLVTAFANAPTPNPYGAPDGIQIHIDYGQGGVFSEGNPIDIEISSLNAGTARTLQADYMDPRRLGYFHYAVFGQRIAPGNGSSGQAFFNSDVFVVTLGFNHNMYNQSQIFMHEIGHNFGLAHFGHNQGGTEKNYKFNYNSVMNYRYSFPGVDLNGDGFGDGALDFSTGTNLTINENSINEQLGLVGVPLDINRNGIIDQQPYARNISCMENISFPCGMSASGQCGSSACLIIRDFDDWSNLNWDRLPNPITRVSHDELLDDPCPSPSTGWDHSR